MHRKDKISVKANEVNENLKRTNILNKHNVFYK